MDGAESQRLFWIIALSLCVTGCTLMIIKIREKLDTTPVMVTFAETATSVWNVPFPAVTVCPETKSRQTDFNFTEYRKIVKDMLASGISTENITLEEQIMTLSNETKMRLRALDLVCEDTSLIDDVQLLNYTIDDEALKFLQSSTIRLDEEFEYCNSKGSYIGLLCNEVFKPVWSEEGVCFTFNMLNDSLLYRSHVVNNKVLGENQSEVGSDWHPDEGYNETAGLKSRPWRASVMQDLTIILTEKEEDIDYVCRMGSTGYKIIFHSPVEMPLLQSNLVVHVPFDKQVTVSLSPKYMTTSPGLKDYYPHKRQCYFSDEKYLQHFPYYTRKSCELECLANETLSLCGCVPFYMPRNSSTNICNITSLSCCFRASEKLKELDIKTDLKRRAAQKLPNSILTKCDCLPSCVSLDYEADTTQAKISAKKYFKERGTTGDLKRWYSVIRILFKDSQFIASRRSELYGKVDFLASCGGILGLFSGFSIVSLIELVYFLTIRIWSNMYCRWKRRRSTLNKMLKNQN